MRAAIYARYSSDLQSDRSIEDQVAIARDHADRQGVDVVEIYTDHAISGATRDRPGLIKLLDDARVGRFDVVIAEALDRISRDQEDIAWLFKRLKHVAVTIDTAAEGPISELHIGLKGTMNALFLKDLAEKVRRGQSGRAAAGKAPGGKCYGYKVVRRFDANDQPVRGERVIDPDQAAVVRRIFEDYAAGMTCRQIAKSLNDDKTPSATGGSWSASTLHGNRSRGYGFLHNELYNGRLIYNRVTYVRDPDSNRRIARINPRDEWFVTEVPDLKIIDDDLWRYVQDRLDRYGGHSDRSVRRPKRLLSGLVKCGCCGGNMTIVDNREGGRLACRNNREAGTCANKRRLSYAEVERRLFDGIRAELLAPDYLAEFVGEFERCATERRRHAAHESKRLARQSRELEQQIARIVVAIADGTDSPALRARLVALEAEKADLARTAEPDEPNASDVALMPDLAKRYRAKVAVLEKALTQDPRTHAVAAEAIRELVDAITATPREGRAQWDLKLTGRLEAILALVTGTASERRQGTAREHEEKWVMAMASPGGRDFQTSQCRGNLIFSALRLTPCVVSCMVSCVVLLREPVDGNKNQTPTPTLARPPLARCARDPKRPSRAFRQTTLHGDARYGQHGHR